MGLYQDILFRVNAGLNVGYGHVVRCLQIARELKENYLISFCVYAEKKKDVERFFSEVKSETDVHQIIYVEHKEEDLRTIVDYVQKHNAFLVLDHYDVNEQYQLYLKGKGVHWLQLDSHAAQKFYGDVVQHGSPGATEKLYAPLHGSSDTKFLLGPKYVIVNRELRNLHTIVKPRSRVRKVFVSFGGGYAKGALLKYIEPVGRAFPELVFEVVLRGTHPDLDILKLIEKENKNIHLYINYDAVYQLMCESDIAILAPGGMSYEAATVGLPAILVAIEDNQLVNLKGCSDLGISKSLGLIDDVMPQDVVEALNDIKNTSEKLHFMSTTALREFDGKGVERIVHFLKNKLLNPYK